MAVAKEFLYEKIYRDLLDAIGRGDYQPGDRLPSEKELAQAYDASRITSKRALEMLSEEGIIKRMPGRGSFVRLPEERMHSENLQSGEVQSGESQSTEEQPDRTQASLLENSGIKIRKRKMIGVILDSFGNDFGCDLLKSIERECRKRNYDMLLRCTYGSIEEENRAIWNAVELGAQGLILMCAQGETYNTTIIQLSLEHFPMVLVDRQMQGISIPCIKTDNYQASRALTRWLFDCGYKNICFVSHSSMQTTTIRERYEGFVDEIVKEGETRGRTVEITGYHPTAENEEEEYADFDSTEIRKAILENRDCNAFLTVEYKLGILFLRELKSMGMSDKKVVSFDGLSRMYGDYGFTHAKQNENEMGAEAVETIDRIIRGETVKGNICIPFQIVEM